MSTEASAGTRRKRRSLIMAGGGIKVAFQAGVLQVWLDEAGLTFEHADGASGGTFNLAMYCQGMTGTEIADNWRTLPPSTGLSFNWAQYLKLPYAQSLMKMDRFKQNVFAHWGLDWDKIRASDREATFNTFNFTKQELEVLSPSQMTPDFLVACVSLPIWFPPVVVDGQTYIDAVYVTDANLEEAIRRGADELWIIWTVSERGEWNDGFIAQYFQIIEAAANGVMRRVLQRIEENNAALTEGRHAEFGRHIDVKMLRAEVPMHYIINLSGDRVNESVNRGVQAGRRWCAEQGIPLKSAADRYPTDLTSVAFTEVMRGHVGFGETSFEQGEARGKRDQTPLLVRLTIKADGIDRFLRDPGHPATITGYVSCEALGGKLRVEDGAFELFVDDGDPRSKRMLYRLFFRDITGRPLTLTGFKTIEDGPGLDIWPDTTTLYTRMLRGHVSAEQEAHAEVVASGIIRIHLPDFLRQLTTFRSSGPDLKTRADALGRFAAFFLGRLWDVYARRALSYGPF